MIRTYENQQHRASGLNLLVTAIVALEHSIPSARHCRAESELEKCPEASPPRPSVPARLGEHVNITGDYVWAAPSQITENYDGLRPPRRTPPEGLPKGNGLKMFLVCPLVRTQTGVPLLPAIVNALAAARSTMLAQHDVNQSAVADRANRDIAIGPAPGYTSHQRMQLGPILPLRRRRRFSASVGVSLASQSRTASAAEDEPASQEHLCQIPQAQLVTRSRQNTTSAMTSLEDTAHG